MSDVYLGNPLLKKANTPIEFTQEQIEEFIKCKDDPVYFAKNYVKIVTLDHGLQPFKMYPFQEKLINNFHNHRFNICKMPRQTGKSTTVVSFLLHYAVFNDNVNIGILANKAATARELLDRLQTAYENLPKWMQQGIISWNKGSLELENGSKILAASTSASAVRGMSFNILFLDEFAFVPNHIADSFFASVYPTITSGKNTKVIIVSTPHGMNHFYRMWHDAEKGKNEYVFTDVHWSEVPGRDEAWKSKQLQTHQNNSLKLSLSVNF
jgi:phage terminase large subunit-like protein